MMTMCRCDDNDVVMMTIRTMVMTCYDDGDDDDNDVVMMTMTTVMTMTTMVAVTVWNKYLNWGVKHKEGLIIVVYGNYLGSVKERPRKFRLCFHYY